MNLDIFKHSDPSGRMSKENFVFKNHKEEYDYIIDYCQSNQIFDIPFKEKVYLCLNNFKSVPVCKNPNCDRRVKFKNSSLGYSEYCSTKCISTDPIIKKIKEQKSLEKFGTKTPSQSKKIKEKIIQSNLIKWGFNSPMCSEEVKIKSKRTLLENWGVDNPTKSEIISRKRVESFKKSDYKETFKKTSLEKYGVSHPWMNKNIHQKTIEFFYKSYKERIESKIDSNKFKFIGFKKDISTKVSFLCKTCNTNFDILTYQFYYRINSKVSICTNCYPIAENSSISQIELYNFIKTNYSGEILLNCKNIITPYEIDIYLPDLKIGFEFNGVWWHSDKFKGENYHLKKYELSNSIDISLISIWEDDWNTKREICESFILNKLGKTPKKIFARKCKVKNISYMESMKFLNDNHLQGDCKSSIRLGLYFENTLVSIMTFSKLRLPLQKLEKNRNKKGCFELTRFCNKTNTNVVGGASKLLTHFIESYKPSEIETYSDNLISNGNLYKIMGFGYKHTSKPGYWYVIDGIRHHRFNWRKQKLVKLGYNKDKSEEEIMSELGYYRIYNAGNKKWILEITQKS